MVKLSRQAEEALKSFLTPGALFEELGFEYVDPWRGTASTISSRCSATSRNTTARCSSTC